MSADDPEVVRPQCVACPVAYSPQAERLRLEGDVVVVKGTMIMRADKVVVTEDQYGFQKGVATGGKGGLARIRQKLEGREAWFDGEAERIEYNTANEVAEFFRHAWVKNGDDQVRGDYIWYDGISEKYLVTAGKASDPKAPPPRVRPALDLRGAGALGATPGRN